MATAEYELQITQNSTGTFWCENLVVVLLIGLRLHFSTLQIYLLL
jgi:hypothetical protein